MHQGLQNILLFLLFTFGLHHDDVLIIFQIVDLLLLLVIVNIIIDIVDIVVVDDGSEGWLVVLVVEVIINILDNLLSLLPQKLLLLAHLLLLFLLFGRGSWLLLGIGLGCFRFCRLFVLELILITLLINSLLSFFVVSWLRRVVFLLILGPIFISFLGFVRFFCGVGGRIRNLRITIRVGHI